VRLSTGDGKLKNDSVPKWFFLLISVKGCCELFEKIYFKMFNEIPCIINAPYQQPDFESHWILSTQHCVKFILYIHLSNSKFFFAYLYWKYSITGDRYIIQNTILSKHLLFRQCTRIYANLYARSSKNNFFQDVE
jgi:cellulose synthase/poly-beta-1,6-N-acetylglucosamine synthase-like glycosyltransferase